MDTKFLFLERYISGDTAEKRKKEKSQRQDVSGSFSFSDEALSDGDSLIPAESGIVK